MGREGGSAGGGEVGVGGQRRKGGRGRERAERAGNS